MKTHYLLLLIAILGCFSGIRADVTVDDDGTIGTNQTVTYNFAKYLLSGGIRKDLNGKDVAPQFCGYESGSGCHYLEYAQSLAILAIPGIAVGALSVIGLIVFTCIKCCCCCGNRDFSTVQIVTLKIVIIITAIVIGGMLIGGFVGNAQAGNGGKNFIGNTIGFGEDIQAIVRNISVILDQFPELGINLDSTEASAQEIIDTAKDVQKQYETYEGYRSKAFIAVYVVLAVMCLVAVLSCFIWLCISGHINFCMGLFLIVFMWIVFSICLSFGTATTDVCKVFDAQLESAAAGQEKPTEILGSFLGSWGADCSAFGDLVKQSTDTFENYTTQFCSTYNELCSGGGKFEGNCHPCNQSTDLTELTRITYIPNFDNCPSTRCYLGPVIGCYQTSQCYTGNVTISNCVTECYTSEARDAAKQAVDLARYHRAVQILIQTVSPYVGCKLVTAFVQKVHDPLCNGVAKGLGTLVVISAIIGIFLIAFCVEMILSIDRFNPRQTFPESEQGDDIENEPEVLHQTKSKLKLSRGFTGTFGFVPQKTFVVEPQPQSTPGGGLERKLSVRSFPSISRNTGNAYDFSARPVIPSYNPEWTEDGHKKEANIELKEVLKDNVQEDASSESSSEESSTTESSSVASKLSETESKSSSD